MVVQMTKAMKIVRFCCETSKHGRIVYMVSELASMLKEIHMTSVGESQHDVSL
jgi:hypothetical protein